MTFEETMEYYGKRIREMQNNPPARAIFETARSAYIAGYCKALDDCGVPREEETEE